jgi:hypothetical protein
MTAYIIINSNCFADDDVHITKDYVQTKEGTLSKNYYYIPKYYMQYNLPTAVSIKFAYQSPFPNEKASKDLHTCMRMSAAQL